MTDDYQQIRQKLQEHFEKQEFEQALEIAKEICENFPDRYIAAYFNLAYMQAALGQIEDTIATLEEAYEKGAWWAADNLNAFPNSESLKASSRFQAVQEKIQQRFEKEQQASKLKWVVREPPNYKPSKSLPLLIALHWGDSSIEEFEPYWKDAVLKAGILLALPQSSQIVGPNSYTWMNLDLGLKELEQAYSEIKDKYAIDSAKVFLTGASIGGTLALEATFRRSKFPVKGVIAVIPYNIQPAELTANIAQMLERKVRCCVVTGSKDPSIEACKDFVSLMKKHGMEHLFYESVGTGHIIPADFDQMLDEILPFLLKD
ncbi:MAG: hypothetical protein ACXADX_14515 [Candidatus Hodarchaeales archaeon]|jgi:predicted esterase